MAKQPNKTLHERTVEADTNMRRITANAQEAEANGQTKRAKRLWEAAQKALDKYNKLAGRA